MAIAAETKINLWLALGICIKRVTVRIIIERTTCMHVNAKT